MDSDLFSDNISSPEISIGKDNKGFNFLMFIILLITFIIVVVPWDKLGMSQENMSGGTVAQMFAQDSQDVYLKGNVDRLATGNFNLFWNQPTREANVFQNRGQPLYSILLPDTPKNPNPTMLEVPNNYINDIVNNKFNKKLNELRSRNQVLTLNDVSSNQSGLNSDLKSNNKSNDKSNVKSLIPIETTNLEKVNGEELEQTDYLSLPETPKTSKSTKSTKSTKSIKSNSIPTLENNQLPSSLPIDVLANSNPYELTRVAKQVSDTQKTANNLPPMTNWNPQDYLFQAYMNRAINDKNCRLDPASCTGFSGGARLPDGFNQSTKAVPYVNLDGNYFYPDSYVGSYWIEPNFDINKPYPWIPNGNRV